MIHIRRSFAFAGRLAPPKYGKTLCVCCDTSCLPGILLLNLLNENLEPFGALLWSIIVHQQPDNENRQLCYRVRAEPL